MKKLLEILKKLGMKPEEIETLQAELEEEAEENVQGLKNKNNELIGKMKLLKSGGDGDAQRLAEENAKLQEQNEKLDKAFKKLELEKGKIEKDLSAQLASEQAAISKLLVEDGLTNALTKAGVTNPTLLASARALLKERGIVKIKTEGDVRRAIAILKKDGKDVELELETFVAKEWVSSDEGKVFVPASRNAGGGAQGGAAGGGASDDLQTKYDEAQKKGDVDGMLKAKRQMQLAAAKE
jgi:hypothetical protein